jgi:hypothetical protein
MAARVQQYIRNFEDILKGYLYEGPLTLYCSILEQKIRITNQISKAKKSKK